MRGRSNLWHIETQPQMPYIVLTAAEMRPNDAIVSSGTDIPLYRQAIQPIQKIWRWALFVLHGNLPASPELPTAPASWGGLTVSPAGAAAAAVDTQRQNIRVIHRSQLILLSDTRYGLIPNETQSPCWAPVACLSYSCISCVSSSLLWNFV